MPVILNEEHYNTWLNTDTGLGKVTELLKPYPSNLTNAYPISPDIKNPKNNRKELILPVGEKLFTDFNLKVSDDLEEKGFGGNKRKMG
jgi:putative SOS response-associated peptidase YedK